MPQSNAEQSLTLAILRAAQTMQWPNLLALGTSALQLTQSPNSHWASQALLFMALLAGLLTQWCFFRLMIDRWLFQTWPQDIGDWTLLDTARCSLLGHSRQEPRTPRERCQGTLHWVRRALIGVALNWGLLLIALFLLKL